MMADRTINVVDWTVHVVDKESWLRVAQGWLSLIRKSRQSPAELFSEDVETRGTKQDNSTNSH